MSLEMNAPIEIGSVVDGTVTGIKAFGAFIQLPGGQTGLCHISEVSHGFVKSIEEHLEHNQPVKVKVIGVDDKGKISLSIRQTAPKPEYRERSYDERPKVDFEDMLADYMKSSVDKQRDLKKALGLGKKKGAGGRR